MTRVLRWGRTLRTSTGLWHIEHNGRALCRFSSQLRAIRDTAPEIADRCLRCTSMLHRHGQLTDG